jgi:hypothetical protein
MDEPKKFVRPLLCPICGARVELPSHGGIPETFRIPDHVQATDVNMCQGTEILVTLTFAKCLKCGCNISKHPSGLCSRCYMESL